MKATELRIGNIVNYKINDEIDERKEWNEENIIDALDLVAITQCEIAKMESNYLPIPLTEEWIKKFGFIIEKGTPANSNALFADFTLEDIVSPNGGYSSTLRTFRIYVNKDFSSIHIQADKDKWYPSIKYFKYVHELQNLYYMISNKELLLAVTPINTKTNGV